MTNNTFLRFVLILFLSCLLSCLLSCTQSNSSPLPPYPQSQLLSGVSFNWNSHKRMAEGSDNWPVTWGNDNYEYTTWGDGGGFGGSNSEGRVSFGIARISGDNSQVRGENILGGVGYQNTFKIDGKSYGIVDIEGVLYTWVSPGSNIQGYERATLYYSINSGLSWKVVNWSFEKKEGLIFPTFLQFGKSYEGSLDDFLYIYSISLKTKGKLSIQKPGQVFLIRVPRTKLLDKKEYRFYAGLKKNGETVWINELEDAIPVFEDSINGVGWTVSVSYNNGLNRYFLITEHTESFKSNIGIYDSPSPWGPWSTVYFGRLGENYIQDTCFFYNFSNKRLSQNGQEFSLIFSGIKSNDSFNVVRGKFLSHEPFQ